MAQEETYDVTVAGAMEGIDVVFDNNDITSIAVGRNILGQKANTLSPGLLFTFPNSYDKITKLRVLGACPTFKESFLYAYIGSENVLFLPNLQSVFLERVNRIEKFAFRDFVNLTQIRLPKTVTTIEDDAFVEVVEENGTETQKPLPNLQTFIVEDLKAWCTVELWSLYSNPCYSSGSIYEEGESNPVSSLDSSNISEVPAIKDGVFANCKSLISIDLPESVDYIGAYSFADCTNLESASFPASLSFIADFALADCSKLNTMIFNGNAPELWDNPFLGISSTCKVYVKEGTTGWGTVPGTWNGFDIDYLTE